MAIPLADHPLVAGVAPEALRPVLDSARLMRVQKGDLLAMPGALRTELLLVLDGFLQSYDLTDNGSRVLYEVVGPGGFDGALGVLGGVAHFTEAISHGCVASIKQSAMDESITADAGLAGNLVRALARRISRREHQLAAASLKDPSKQIARQLLAIAETLGDGPADATKLQLHLTHQQIADMLGIRRETATIHLNLLARTGAVRLEPNGMRVSRNRLRGVLDDRLAVRRA